MEGSRRLALRAFLAAIRRCFLDFAGGKGGVSWVGEKGWGKLGRG